MNIYFNTSYRNCLKVNISYYFNPCNPKGVLTSKTFIVTEFTSSQFKHFIAPFLHQSLQALSLTSLEHAENTSHCNLSWLSTNIWHNSRIRSTCTMQILLIHNSLGKPQANNRMLTKRLRLLFL